MIKYYTLKMYRIATDSRLSIVMGLHGSWSEAYTFARQIMASDYAGWAMASFQPERNDRSEPR